ncbi:FAD/NAD(P)-binding domain-containing protein [Macrolepiota fuliginosa MF-IS2]|uniref:FAD/NAD(P)-binding domain-containing protein n=1 Tax=Macrolepiota fuliginosa MF-IS2 TaxID=1400762 RepID=A0A9P6BYU3_9AGAR|nr:FAD/NAD(P)-binding domain-containing protein [Macrolepiota fuliginosa MF-IS2]
MVAQTGVLSEPIGIIGAGPAGLINAHVLLQDGFTNIQLITRDASVGGVWARERVYPGLHINNVHGEYRFSALEMPPPTTADGRLSGLDMSNYMERFYETFLKDKVNFIFSTKVLDISRDGHGRWRVQTEHQETGATEILEYSRIILSTGGCSEPSIPECLSLHAAERAQYRGIVIHSSEFGARIDDILKYVEPNSEGHEGSIVVIGGGKSAQDICAKLTHEGRKVSIVFDKTDVFLAAKTPLPPFIRKSRFLGIISPHVHLRTRLERFLHGTVLGAKITRFVWDKINESSFAAFDIPGDSPLRNTHSLFWGVRTNDEGVPRPDSYHTLAVAGKIEVIAPARVAGFATDGRSVLLDDGRSIVANAVILATGYKSSWTKIFTDKTAEELGINKHAPTTDVTDVWDYPSLSGAPPLHPDSKKWVASIYRGLVPAKNILRRDFAIAGALFTSNVGYTSEVAAHWISSYFQNDPMRLPGTVEEALAEAERGAAWMRRRFPDMLSWVNESYSCSLDFFTWPQAVDDLLEDMRLPIYRSGGSWLTWPFKVIDLKEIASLGDERRERRIEAVVISK